MSARFLAYLASAWLVLAGAIVASAATPTPRLITRVYQVADLVVPTPDTVFVCGDQTGQPPAKRPQTTEDRLMKVIARTVQPRSWAEMGGAATMDYFPLSMALVVKQTAEAHAQIDKL